MYLETRVNDFLKRHNHPESGEVTVRVVHVSDKVVEVKPGMKSRSDRMIMNRHWFNTTHLSVGHFKNSYFNTHFVILYSSCEPLFVYSD